jgi:hypothetical protein
MAGAAGSSNPGGCEPVVVHRLPPVGKVAELQPKLWAAARPMGTIGYPKAA